MTSFATRYCQGTGVENATFWANFVSIVHELTPKNRALLARRDELQAELDAWYRRHGAPVDMEAYRTIVIVVDAVTPIGQAVAAGISNIVLESTVIDCEDSVAAFDAEDKVVVYRNWLGLMKGDLEEEVTKAGQTFIRKLDPDVEYKLPDGSGTLPVKGRSLMLVRNVGHLMTIPAIQDRHGNDVPEGIMDHRPDRAPRYRPERSPQEFRSRFDLRGQAEDARTGRGRLRVRKSSPASSRR